MKVRVISRFVDKYTGDTKEVGDVLQVNKKRAKELLGDNSLKAVFAEEIKDDEE